MDGFTVTRIEGSPHGPGKVQIETEESGRWTVPVVERKGRLWAAHNDYESLDANVGPSWELRGDLNDAVHEFLESEQKLLLIW